MKTLLVILLLCSCSPKMQSHKAYRYKRDCEKEQKWMLVRLVVVWMLVPIIYDQTRSK